MAVMWRTSSSMSTSAIVPPALSGMRNRSFTSSGVNIEPAPSIVIFTGRGIAPAQVPGAKISVSHGVGGMFAASGTIIMSNEPA